VYYQSLTRPSRANSRRVRKSAHVSAVQPTNSRRVRKSAHVSAVQPTNTAGCFICAIVVTLCMPFALWVIEANGPDGLKFSVDVHDWGRFSTLPLRLKKLHLLQVCFAL